MTHRGNSLSAAAQCVHDGGVIAYPAEACFGIGCHPENTRGLMRIREMKSRSAEQGFILVADALPELRPYLHWEVLEQAQRQRIDASWPGPITWLIPASARSDTALRGRFSTLAVRVTAFSSLKALCRAVGGPLVSTSANRGGQAPLTTADEVEAVFADEIDYLLDLPIQGLDSPSQIIDAVTGTTIRAA